MCCVDSVIVNHVTVQSIEHKWVFLQVCCLSHLSVCLRVQKMYCGKMSDWVPFWVVNGVGRGRSILDGGGDCQRGRGNFGVNVGHSIVTNGDFVA